MSKKSTFHLIIDDEFFVYRACDYAKTCLFLRMTITETWNDDEGRSVWRGRTGCCADLQIPATASFALPISREAPRDGRGGGS
jgi:hypothetical protein